MSITTVYYNGTIITADDDYSIYEAIAIRDGKIVQLGSSQELTEQWKQEGARVQLIDLERKAILPAFYDSHAHIYGAGFKVLRPRLDNATSIEAIHSLLTPLLSSDSNKWIVARGWDQQKCCAEHFPTRQNLDALTTTQPIALYRIDGHTLWCNSKALEVCGIDRNTEDCPGGTIVRDANGEPTGVFVDETMKFILAHIPPEEENELKHILETGLRQFLEHGHIAVHDMGVDRRTWEGLKALYQEKGDQLPKAYIFIDLNKLGGVEFFLERMEAEIFSDSTHERLKLVGPKIYFDGALGSRGAQLFEDYADDPGNKGLALSESRTIHECAELAAENGLQIAVHAIGDKANARVLDLFEKLNAKATLRIEHAQILRPEELKRFATINVHTLVQPAFFATDREWAVERLGKERMKNAYRWKSLTESGATLIGSSDSPIEEGNALEGIRIFITRDGAPEDGEALTEKEALRAYTIVAARLVKEDHVAGSLEVGKSADMVILSHADFLQKPKVIATLMGGCVLYGPGGETPGNGRL